ncbi:hypothetical protein PENFLA_c111G02962 [Penicillium flavigenum]|uniref:Uncharacterized protein n=1 Tax=Penicillium flavigenum TaxID=254877 RepID=A0A1V6S611_9EURO|nr:hypothetical protein PENFLA_c111G02962 [Penicillium flavigenum]
MFPKGRVDENRLFTEITAPIAQVENWTVFLNDLLPFYKEFDERRDQTSLVKNYAQHDRRLGVTRQRSRQGPRILRTMRTFLQGYVTSHLCDLWYQLQELHSLTKQSAVVPNKLYNHLQSAKEVGSVDPRAWAYPSMASLAAENATT